MVHRLTFSIIIPAEKSAIWKALWDDASYRNWASIFFEGSYMVVKDWEAGNKVHFLSPDQSGIYSTIEKHEPNECIRFRHIGTVLNGKEQDIDEETKLWSGATESYSITEEDGQTVLSIDIDVMDEHLEFMKAKLPIALEKIKNISTTINDSIK